MTWERDPPADDAVSGPPLADFSERVDEALAGAPHRPSQAPPRALRFDVNDRRFKRVQELFATHRPEEGRALLRELLREWLARHSKKRADALDQ
jgi:hypothetical protein